MKFNGYQPKLNWVLIPIFGICVNALVVEYTFAKALPAQENQEEVLSGPAQNRIVFLPPTSETGFTRKLVAVRLNGELINEGVSAYCLGDAYWIAEEAFRDSPLDLSSLRRYSKDLTISEGQRVFINPDSIDGLSAKFVADTQTIELSAQPSAYISNTLENQNSFSREPDDSVTAGFINYAFNTAYSDDEFSNSAFLETGLTLPKSVLTNTLVWSDSADSSPVRLETSWIKDLPEQRLRITVGDAAATAAGGSELGSTYRFGGLQMGTRFETQPGFVRHPVPSVFGEAFGKSTVDLFVDEALKYRTEADIGPFSVERLPINNGAGDVRVVVTDVLGREQVFVQPFYVNSRLLDVGLSDYEINLGAVRNRFGVESASYGEKFFAGRYRRGLTRFFTAQTVAEVSESHSMAGISSTLLLKQFGSLALSYSVSDHDEFADGTKYSAAYDYQGSKISFGARWSQTDENFTTLQTLESANRVKNEFTSNLRISPFRNSTLSLIHTEREFHDNTDLKISSVAYTQRILDNWSVNLTASRLTGLEIEDESLVNFENERLSLSIVRAFSDRRTASLKTDYRAEVLPDEFDEISHQLSLRKSSPRGVGYGYRLAAKNASRSDSNEFDGRLDINTNRAIYNLSAVRASGVEYVNASVDGSVVITSNNVFTQRPIRNGFALIDTGGNSEIPVYRGGTLAAKTNKNGYAILPELVPYTDNKLKIHAEDFPIKSRIEKEEASISPYFKGGVKIGFGVSEENGMLIILKLNENEYVPPGTLVTSEQTEFRDRLAFNGQLYLRGLDEAEEFSALLGTRYCHFSAADVVKARVKKPAKFKEVICRSR